MCKELEAPRQQCRGVERVRLIVLAQHAAVTNAVREDVGPDLVRSRAPCRCLLRVASNLRQRARPVQGDPAHYLGGHVMLWLAASLPNALVGVAPDTAGALRLRLDD